MQPRRPQKRLLHWLPGFFALLTATSVHAAPLIKIDSDFSRADLANYVDVLVDASAQLSIEQVTQLPLVNEFARANIDTFPRADQHSAYWLRFGIINPLPEARALALTYSLPNSAEVIAFGAPDLHRIPTHQTPQLQLIIPAQSRQLYYLRVGPGALPLAQFELLSVDRYLQNFRYWSWFDGVLQGGTALIIIASLFLAALRRDSIYLWLAGHCAAFQLFQIFFHPDFNPLLFEYVPRWSYLHPLPQICLLLASVCTLRLAQCFPITTPATAFLVPALKLMLTINLLALPIPFVASELNAALSIYFLSTLTALTTIAIALYGFVVSHQRSLLAYAVIRTTIILLSIGGALAWQTDSGAKTLAKNLAPVAMLIEAFGLLALLMWRSVQQRQQAARNEREIAVFEAESRSRTDVVAEVGHRVRTPVSGMLGMLDMLQDTPLSAVQLDYLNTIRRAGHELLNVVDEMSDVSRLQLHTSKLQQNIFDPQALVMECVDGFRSLAAAHHLELINDPAPALPAYVSGDLTRLRQILLQLLHQVVGQHERGEILLRVQPLPQRHWLRFEIKTHAEIAHTAPSEIDRRINPAGSANVRLAIARQLIDLLGGRLQVEDASDGNLLAWFDLPLPPVGRDEPSNAQEAILHGKQLLVVDDNATFCEVLRRQLGHWNMSVYTAGSASEGLARLRNQMTLNQPIDVLLIDADMPELQQSDWLQRVRGEILPMPLIILLASEPELGSRQQQQLNIRRVLMKPVNHTSLKITLIEEFKQRDQRTLPMTRSQSAPIRCLFAEDNLINAKVLAGMLGKLGVEFTATSNGQEAVEACRRERFDIILMDCDMPVMDGWEASRRIREIHENRGMHVIPIIALTANTVEELGERARQPAMDAHLVKPVRLQNLRELLEQWTGKIVTVPTDTPN
ncbi:MAG TPA: response regulator [Spongiibacteraceae bacterium]